MQLTEVARTGKEEDVNKQSGTVEELVEKKREGVQQSWNVEGLVDGEQVGDERSGKVEEQTYGNLMERVDGRKEWNGDEQVQSMEATASGRSKERHLGDTPLATFGGGIKLVREDAIEPED